MRILQDLMGCISILILTLLFLGASPPAAPREEGQLTVRGKARYQNGDPDVRIRMDADLVCSSLHEDAVYTERVVVDQSGGLANVFVWIGEGSRLPAPPTSNLPEARLVQKGCLFEPHVLGVRTGQSLVIRNEDATLHNIHAVAKKNRSFNYGQPFAGLETTHRFDRPEMMVRFKCDIHPWMSAWLAVLDHPFFAVTAEDGSFSIPGVPPGTYTIEAWHESLGTRSRTLLLGAESGELEFDFSRADPE